MTGDEHAVLRRDEIGLDVVRPHLRRQAIARQRVLGAMPRRAAVADDEGCRHGCYFGAT